MKNETQFRLIMAAILGLALIFGVLAFAPTYAVTTYDAIRLRGIVGTATPVLQIDSRGVPMELRVNSTPVLKVDSSGISNSANQLTFDDKVLIDGSADAHQLTVQGYTTQTNNLLVLENSAGTDQFVVDGSGNVTTMGQFDESVFVDGEADEVQLTVSGYTTQTNNLLVLEQSDGTNVAAIDGSGNTTLTGTLGTVGNGTFSADLIVDDTFNIDDTTVSISGTQTVTPTYSVMVVAPTVASTITLATGSASAGDFLLVLNTVATNTNIVDTGATVGGGAIDLGANDIALFIYLNSKWVEIASPDNS